MINRYLSFFKTLLSFLIINALFLGCNNTVDTSTTSTSTTTTIYDPSSTTVTTTTTTTMPKAILEVCYFLKENKKSSGNSIYLGSVEKDLSTDSIYLLIRNVGSADMSGDLTEPFEGDFTGAYISYNKKFRLSKDATNDDYLKIDAKFNSTGKKIGKLKIRYKDYKPDATNDISPYNEFILNLYANSIPKFEMIQVAGGEYAMGSALISNASPERNVKISDFKMSNYEVNYRILNETYEYAIANGYVFKNNDIAFRPNARPASEISWYDALKWCNALSQKEGLTPVYYTNSSKNEVYKTGSLDILSDCVDWNASGYRLPTEAEWEYAARNRGIRSGNEYSGGADITEFARYQGNFTGAALFSGEGKPNELLIYDMSGNLSEWCWDWYGKYTSASPYTDDDSRGATNGEYRIVRGGSCLNQAEACRNSYRFTNYLPNFRGKNVGFRIVKK